MHTADSNRSANDLIWENICRVNGRTAEGRAFDSSDAVEVDADVEEVVAGVLLG